MYTELYYDDFAVFVCGMIGIIMYIRCKQIILVDRTAINHRKSSIVS